MKGIPESILRLAISIVSKESSDFRSVEKFLELAKHVRGVKNEDLRDEDIISTKNSYFKSGNQFISEISDFYQKIFRVLLKINEFNRLNEFTAEYFCQIAKNFENMTLSKSEVPSILFEIR